LNDICRDPAVQAISLSSVPSICSGVRLLTKADLPGEAEHVGIETVGQQGGFVDLLRRAMRRRLVDDAGQSAQLLRAIRHGRVVHGHRHQVFLLLWWRAEGWPTPQGVKRSAAASRGGCRMFAAERPICYGPSWRFVMPLDRDDTTTIAVTAFKGRCLAVIDDVAQDKTGSVVVMKRNRPVAAIVPIDDDPPDLWGAMRGSVTVAPDTDLAAPTGEVWDAEV